MDVLKFSTAGSVDDGKSTLIGRLLYDTNSLPTDKVEDMISQSKKRGLDSIDYSLAVDGLMSEREQGITIDVAHLYFHTKNRKYIIHDNAGHVQYTRNMITGVSNTSAILILVDARKGMLEQTKRHLFIASLMQVSQVIVVVNKMDTVDYNEEIFNKLKSEIRVVTEKFNIAFPAFIPVSATEGDNVVTKSENMEWFNELPLLEVLEIIPTDSNKDYLSRFNVQNVLKIKSEDLDYERIYTGKVKSGCFTLGDKIIIHPSGKETHISKMVKYEKSVEKATVGESVAIKTLDDVDIQRGDIITKEHQEIIGLKKILAKLCWLNDVPLIVGQKFLLQYGSTITYCKVTKTDQVLNFDSLEFEHSDQQVDMNAIVRVEINTSEPVFLDPYNKNPKNGYFILINNDTNETVAVGFCE